MKDKLLKLKLNFIRKNAPSMTTNWSENKEVFAFYQSDTYDENKKPIIIKKPVWLKCVEFVAYKVMK